MKIICTVKEFGLLVRGCVQNGCYQCPMQNICKKAEYDDGIGIERFVSAEDVVEEEKESEEQQCKE